MHLHVTWYSQSRKSEALMARSGINPCLPSSGG